MKNNRGRSVIVRMVIRRVTLCQLLYKNLARLDEHIQQRDRQMQTVSTCVRSLIIQIRRTQDQNRKSLQRKNQVQFEVEKKNESDPSTVCSRRSSKCIWVNYCVSHMRSKCYWLDRSSDDIACKPIQVNFHSLERAYLNDHSVWSSDYPTDRRHHLPEKQILSVEKSMDQDCVSRHHLPPGSGIHSTRICGMSEGVHVENHSR